MSTSQQASVWLGDLARSLHYSRDAAGAGPVKANGDGSISRRRAQEADVQSHGDPGQGAPMAQAVSDAESREPTSTTPIVLMAARLSDVLKADHPAAQPREARSFDEQLDPIPNVIRRPSSVGVAGEINAPAWPAVLTALALAAAVGLTILMLVETHRLPALHGLVTGARSSQPAHAIAPVIWPSETTTGSTAAAQSAEPESDGRGLMLRAGPAVVTRSDTVPSVLQAADSRLAQGDVIGARILLLSLGASGGADVKLALAETYDPNALAARGITEAQPDVQKARDFYAEAQALGHAKARRRLEMLPQW